MAGEQVEDAPEGLAVTLKARAESEVNRLLVQAGVQVSHLVREQASLESLFFDLVGEAA